MLNYNPIPIRSWEFIDTGTVVITRYGDFTAQPREFVRVHFIDGSSLLTRRHPTAHLDCGSARLYGGEGESLCFFSLSSFGFNEIKPVWTKAMEKGVGGSKYPSLRHFCDEIRPNGILCHHAMCEIWYGPRDPQKQLHHLNRDKFDWCANNLIELSIPEHKNADARQKLVESIVGDLHLLTHDELRYLTLLPGNEFLHEVEKMKLIFNS